MSQKIFVRERDTQHARQGRLAAGAQRFPQGRFFARARNQHPDLSCRGNCRVAQRNPARRRLGRIFDGQKRAGAIQNFGRRTRETATRHGRPRPCREKSNPAPAGRYLVAGTMRRSSASAILAADLRRIFAANPVNLAGRDFQRREQKLVGQLEIAFRVGGRNAALVRPEKMDVCREERRAAVPNFPRSGQFDRRGEEFLRDAPAGKRDAMRFARAVGRFDFVQPRAGGARASSSALAKESSSKFFINQIWEGRRVAVPN